MFLRKNSALHFIVEGFKLLFCSLLMTKSKSGHFLEAYLSLSCGQVFIRKYLKGSCLMGFTEDT